MLKNKINIRVAAATLAVTFFSCKERTILGTELVPAVDNINTFFTDTFTIQTSNVWFDSIPVAKSGTQNCALGTLSGDPDFGSSYAGFAMQFRPSKIGLNLPKTDVVADSLVLTIPYVRTYGDSTSATTTTYNVYRLANEIYKDSIYLINRSFAVNPELIGSATIVNGTINDSITKNNTTKIAPQLRLKLNNSLAQELLNLRDSVEYKYYSNFNTWFKGLMILPADTNNGKAFHYFNFGNAGIELHYRTTGATKDTVIQRYPFDGAYCGHNNFIKRNYTNSKALTHLQSNAVNDSVLYIQGDVGSCVQVAFPYAGNFKNCVVNKAELEFTVLPGTNAIIDSLYKRFDVIDAIRAETVYSKMGKSGEERFNSILNEFLDTKIAKIQLNGAISKETINGNIVYKYKINILPVMQKAISQMKNDVKIKIIKLPLGYALGSGGAILGGALHKTNKATLNLIYTKIN